MNFYTICDFRIYVYLEMKADVNAEKNLNRI